MKKVFVAMLMAGTFAMLFGSCKKQETSEEVNVGLPEFTEEAEGRAYIDIANGNSFKWNANDEIMIYNLKFTDGSKSKRAIYKTNAAAEGKTTARFAKKAGQPALGSKKDGFFVFYPTSKVVADLEGENVQEFDVPAEQEYTMVGNNTTIAEDGMAMACTLSKLNAAFTLQHVFGALKLKVKGAGDVTAITIYDERMNLNGQVTMKLHEVDMDEFSDLQDAYNADEDPYGNEEWMEVWEEYKEALGFTTNGEGHDMTLNVPEVALSNSWTPFMIGLRPGALKYGFTVTIERDGEDDVTYRYVGNQFNIKAGVIKNLELNLNAPGNKWEEL